MLDFRARRQSISHLQLSPYSFFPSTSDSVTTRHATMSKLSQGLNIREKPSLAARSTQAKRKTIFDDSDSGDGADALSAPADKTTSISTLGGLQKHVSRPLSSKNPSLISKKSNAPLQPPKRPPKVSSTENLSSKYTSTKHTQQAQDLDPSIYDYDAVYDSMKAAPLSSNSAASGEETKSKYMAALKAAADVRKKDQIRAKDKLIAKEREAEGDEFADKEKFVTAAYKRQQEEMRRLEEEEKAKEAEAEERRRRDGGGMKALHRSMLEKEDEKHRSMMRAAEENKGKKPVEKAEERKEKTEVEMAKEKGAIVNEDGEVVDKRQLLSAGLNAGAAPKAKKVPLKPEPKTSGRKNESERERETREFEEQLLGKHGMDTDSDGEDVRASKSRKMEDELLAGLGSP